MGCVSPAPDHSPELAAVSDLADDGCGLVCTVGGCTGLYSAPVTITFDFGDKPDDEMSRQENVPEG
jgi:hypothetical protein